MDREPDPTPVVLESEGPMWESDIEEREARRRKILVFGGTAAAILLGFVGIFALLSLVAGGGTTETDPTNDQAVTTAGPPAAPQTVVVTPVIDVETDIDWHAIQAPLGFAERLFASPNGTFYALSTVPGRNINWPIPKAIYKSTDGENWDIVNLGAGVAASDMAVGRNSIYLIGTAPGAGNFNVNAPEFMISSTVDEGATWASSILPSIAAPPLGAPVEHMMIAAKVAASGGTVVAAANTGFFLDYRRVVPAEFSGDMFGYNTDAEGVTVIDYELMDRMFMACEQEMATVGDETLMSAECRQLFEQGESAAAAVAFFTWEELGLGDGQQPVFAEMFLSVDGGEFEAIASPFVPGSDIGALYGVADGFVGVEWQQGPGGQKVWRSADGRTWTEADDLPEFDWITNVGSMGDKTVVIGNRRDSSVVAWENADGAWDVVDLDAILGPIAANAGGRWISGAGVGPLGVVAVFNTFDDRAQREFTEVVVGTASDTWSLVPIADITGIGSGFSDSVVVSADQILIRYQAFEQGRGFEGPPQSLQVIGTLSS